MYKAFLKRTIDLIGAFTGLLLLSPIFLIVTLGLYIANNGKPFFFQLRPMIVSRYEQQLVWEAILAEYKRLEKNV